MLYHNKGGPVSGPVTALVIAGLTVMLLFVLPSLTLADVTEACGECHDDVVKGFSNTPHGTYFNGNPGYNCESCHGSGAAHMAEGGDPELIINPARHDQFGAKEMCLSCHTDRQFDDWSFSAHSTADMSCASCHTVHGGYEHSLKKATPELCYDCHSDVRAATFMPSHHPIAEGKLSCQDCHGVHGGQAKLTMENTGRELCFSCHAEKEGPFIYEHAPVNEDCNVCHTPHGSVADNLLIQSEPSLCLSCHAMHFHTLSYSADGDFETEQAPERGGTSTLDGWKSGMLTKCTQCHTEIHGSDLPSQATSTGGNALTR